MTLTSTATLAGVHVPVREGERPLAIAQAADLGSGRIVASETEAPNMLANLV
jgi:hypothetical protein